MAQAQRNSTFLLLFFIGLTACNPDDEPCNQSLIETFSLEEVYACTDTPNNMQLPFTNDFIIISDQLWFDSLVTGSCLPEVDFETFDLIIGSRQLNRGLNGISYFYNRACPGRRYELRVLFDLNNEVVMPVVTYHVLVPKIGDNEAVDVSIENV